MKQRADEISPEAKVRLAEALDRLIELAEATGKVEDARKWKDEKAKAARCRDYAVGPGEEMSEPVGSLLPKLARESSRFRLGNNRPIDSQQPATKARGGYDRLMRYVKPGPSRQHLAYRRRCPDGQRRDDAS